MSSGRKALSISLIAWPYDGILCNTAATRPTCVVYIHGDTEKRIIHPMK